MRARSNQTHNRQTVLNIHDTIPSGEPSEGAATRRSSRDRVCSPRYTLHRLRKRSRIGDLTGDHHAAHGWRNCSRYTSSFRPATVRCAHPRAPNCYQGTASGTVPSSSSMQGSSSTRARSSGLASRSAGPLRLLNVPVAPAAIAANSRHLCTHQIVSLLILGSPSAAPRNARCSVDSDQVACHRLPVRYAPHQQVSSRAP